MNENIRRRKRILLIAALPFLVSLIGIAGCANLGKTTTKEMIAAVLATHAGDRARVLVTPGNFNNHVGLPLTLLGARAEQAVGVVELGMNAPGEIDYLALLAEPEVGELGREGHDNE